MMMHFRLRDVFVPAREKHVMWVSGSWLFAPGKVLFNARSICRWHNSRTINACHELDRNTNPKLSGQIICIPPNSAS